MKFELGFIGGGRMASAIADGLLQSNPHIKMAVSDPILAEDWGGRPCAVLSLEALFEQCQWLVWAVKPQVFKNSSATWSALKFKGEGMISVMAGIPCASIEKLFPSAVLVRTMPNTPMIQGQGMVALARGAKATEAHLAKVETYFSSVAKTLRVSENQLNGVTAISGSGPAYLFYLGEEVLRQAGELELEPQQALQLWAQTLRGAAAMLEGSTSPQELRVQVTSPGGTTQAALDAFEGSHWGKIFGTALKAAYNRSIELSK